MDMAVVAPKEMTIVDIATKAMAKDTVRQEKRAKAKNMSKARASAKTRVAMIIIVLSS